MRQVSKSIGPTYPPRSTARLRLDQVTSSQRVAISPRWNRSGDGAENGGKTFWENDDMVQGRSGRTDFATGGGNFRVSGGIVMGGDEMVMWLGTFVV